MGYVKWKGHFKEEISKIWVYLAQENAVKCATRSCWKFKAQVLVEWESAII